MVLYGTLILVMVSQGLLIIWALRSGSPVAWTLWGLFVAAAVAGFVVESSVERRRRRDATASPRRER